MNRNRCDHDWYDQWCEECDGYMGQVCLNCGMWSDGGEHMIDSVRWCDCHDDDTFIDEITPSC